MGRQPVLQFAVRAWTEWRILTSYWNKILFGKPYTNPTGLLWGPRSQLNRQNWTLLDSMKCKFEGHWIPLFSLCLVCIIYSATRVSVFNNKNVLLVIVNVEFIYSLKIHLIFLQRPQKWHIIIDGAGWVITNNLNYLCV